MRNQTKSAIAMLVLLPLPVLFGCADDITGPEKDRATMESGERSTPALVVYPDFLSLAPGETAQLGVTLEQRGPDLGLEDLEVRWSSSDPGIVSVSENGEVTALDEGQAIIYAEHGRWIADAGVLVSTDALLPVDRHD